MKFAIFLAGALSFSNVAFASHSLGDRNQFVGLDAGESIVTCADGSNVSSAIRQLNDKILGNDFTLKGATYQVVRSEHYVVLKPFDTSAPAFVNRDGAVVACVTITKR